uniref:Uncharacterized protein n=1 Tax=Parascaris univalens TaxID=6257 RepID=A0A915C4Y9_PARUN
MCVLFGFRTYVWHDKPRCSNTHVSTVQTFSLTESGESIVAVLEMKVTKKSGAQFAALSRGEVQKPTDFLHFSAKTITENKSLFPQSIDLRGIINCQCRHNGFTVQRQYVASSQKKIADSTSRPNMGEESMFV